MVNIMIEHILLRCFDRAGYVREKVYDKGCWNLNHEIQRALDDLEILYGCLYAVYDDHTEEILGIVVR